MFFPTTATVPSYDEITSRLVVIGVEELLE